MGPFRGPYRGSPLRDPCWWAVSTEVAAHWEEVLMGLFRGDTHNRYSSHYNIIKCISFEPIHYVSSSMAFNEFGYMFLSNILPV